MGLWLYFIKRRSFYAELINESQNAKTNWGDLERHLDERFAKYEAIELAVYLLIMQELPATVDRLNQSGGKCDSVEAVNVSYAENMSFVMTELVSLDQKPS